MRRVGTVARQCAGGRAREGVAKKGKRYRVSRLLDGEIGNVFGAPAALAGIAGSTSSELRPYAAQQLRAVGNNSALVQEGLAVFLQVVSGLPVASTPE